MWSFGILGLWNYRINRFSSLINHCNWDSKLHIPYQ
jgi:hypothetical protein